MMERIMTSLVKLSTSRQFQCTNCNFSGKIKKVEGFAIKLCHKHEDFIWHLPFKIDFFATTNSMIVFIRNFCRTSLVLDRTHFENKNIGKKSNYQTFSVSHKFQPQKHKCANSNIYGFGPSILNLANFNMFRFYIVKTYSIFIYWH